MNVDTSALEIAAQVRAGVRSAAAVTTAALQRIARLNPSIHAFVEVWSDFAAEQAARLDQKIAAGQAVGPLAGVPIAIKDNLCVAGQICSCASKMLENFRPTYQATVIDRLVQADAILIGRANMDQFAMGSATEYSMWGPSKNPRDLTRSPGGSSGGSAAAVASGMVPLALGSDTGGSIRQPAAFCGIYGLKPTYGTVSRYGLIAFASSLDQVGPLANSAADLALLLNVIAGHDPKDATSLPNARRDDSSKETSPVDSNQAWPKEFESHAPQNLKGWRIGVIDEQLSADLHPDVLAATQATIKQMEQAGATVVPVDLPHQKYAIATYYLVASCEAASNLSRYDGMHFGYRSPLAATTNQPHAGSLEAVIRASRGAGFGEEVKRRILLGTFALSQGYADQFYNQALKVRRKIREDFDAAFQKVDVLIGPTTAAPAFKIGAHQDDPVAMYQTDLFTVSANLAGIPALSLPVNHCKAHLSATSDASPATTDLPLAVHLQAAPGHENRLLQLAAFLAR